MDLLSADEAKIACERMIRSGQAGVILSAFFTYPAASWICRISPSDLTLVIRGRLEDFKSGAADFKAVRLMLSEGYQVRFQFRLHAKIFAFNDKILLGSSNLTANGLNLLDTGSNIEFSTMFDANNNSMEQINRIVINSVIIDSEKLEILEAHFNNLENDKITNQNCWPIELLNEKNSNILWCAELPHFEIETAISEDYTIWGEIARKVHLKHMEEASELLFRTAAYNWLLNALSEHKDRGLSFGSLSTKLHDILMDDPTPYRKDIKQYLRNIISFISVVKTPINLTKPNYSQVLKLM